ncbi:hypothetical protein CNBB2220 [Cryptococcus deneoformans B-3501A]|uniref:hypothetical protein n=1 Tax=Cryptococcus deneoformans (strain B-3501A) TaxID=283643 RepID=UPI000042F6E5|nr:hypothetical protein CNBB2220 [Cryptococcus neoformans var. neoformans B-3501A]EAL22774.1 hypothetical protein CNBB2220 [Cryptococcus neoformans var. neoformans B-3501A]
MMFDKSSLLVALFFTVFDMAHKAQAVPQPAGQVGEILAGSFNDGITVYANGVVQCGYSNISWTGASPPVTLEIGQGGYYIGTTSVANLTAGWDNHTEWLVNQPEGVDLIFQVVDSSGKTGYVQNIKVGAGDSDCLENSASNSSLTASSGSTGDATQIASSTAISEAVGGASAFQSHPLPKLPNQVRLAQVLLSPRRSRPQPLPPPHRPLLLLRAPPLFHLLVLLLVLLLVILQHLLMAAVLLSRPPMIRQLAVPLLLPAPVEPSLEFLSAAYPLSLQLLVHLQFCSEVFRAVHLMKHRSSFPFFLFGARLIL